MKKLCFDLLRDFCDGLLSLQFRNLGDSTIDGAFHCRACKILHGRAPDAVYPLVYMYQETREEKYLDAARAVFDFGENFVCDDGAVHNDGQSEWKGISVFSAIAICEALCTGGEFLDEETKKRWENRLLGLGKWCYHNLGPTNRSNVNYPITNTYAMALLGKYFGRADFMNRARELADYAMSMVTEGGFIMGEGKPRDGVTPLGCRHIDIGYNMEESLPSLVKYARLVGDEALLDRLTQILFLQLDFMLPDGAWDNTFGSRSYKWTYYGSRTSDGAAVAYVLLADRHPAFMEAARRNVELLKSCTHGGLLYGGPHYRRHGEHPCTHHTFEHAGALAYVLEHLGEVGERASIPTDTPSGTKYYPEINTYKMSCGDYRATVTGYDYALGFGNHPGGGTLSMLWKRNTGPMIAGSTVGYRLAEPNNFQLTTKTKAHRCLVPRLERRLGNDIYNSAYFASPKMESVGCQIKVVGGLANQQVSRLEGDVDRLFTYRLTEEGLFFTAENVNDAEFVLPLIVGELTVICGSTRAREEIFFLTGGFIAQEYRILPDENGRIEFAIR